MPLRLCPLWAALVILFAGCANTAYLQAKAENRHIYDPRLRDYYNQRCLWSWEIERIHRKEAMRENRVSWYLKYKFEHRITLCDNLDPPPSEEL